MHRAYNNIVPVANKYLAHKQFVQDQQDHLNNIKNAQGIIDQSSPPARPHCYERVRQKTIKEHELNMIEHENERLRTKMEQNGAFVKTQNKYSIRSLNIEKRQRDEAQHRAEIDRLQKQIKSARTSYSNQVYRNEYAKQQDLKLRISRFPSNPK